MAIVPKPEDPVHDDEGLLRRISIKVWMPAPSDPPPLGVFLPQKPIPKSGHPGDINGLSVSRESLSSPASMSLRPDGRRFHVARLLAARVRKIGLSVIPDPQPDDPGHSLIPEMNIVDYQNSPERKRWIKEQAARLASIAVVIVSSQPAE